MQILDDDDGEWKPSPRFRLVDPDPLSASRMKQLQKLRRERNKANAGEASERLCHVLIVAAAVLLDRYPIYVYYPCITVVIAR